MDEKELQQELQCVRYRQKIVNIIEVKLQKMKVVAEKAKEENLSPIELEILNYRLNILAEQVRALDSESRIMQDGKILE